MKPVYILVAVTFLDYVIGDPPNWPHPIAYIGKLISWLEYRLRKYGLATKIGGFILFLLTVLITLSILTLIIGLSAVGGKIVESIVLVYFLTSALAATCLKKEVMKVASALENGTIEESRLALSYLVGRDTQALTHEGIIRGTVETTAENTIDGVIAPIFYMVLGLILGCPVQMVFLYKTINTLDSMVGYIQEPYTHIGYVSAKMDDLVNLIPARLGSLLMLLSGFILKLDVGQGLRIWKRDCGKHKSPNAGYPESVVAGLLGIRLGGTHTYFSQVLEKPIIGDSIREIEVHDIKTTTQIMYVSEGLLILLSSGLLLLIS
ncbi:Cobalamin biosynthesis protein CobD [Petrocella atlantisensis]|uniref:Cobalamin biosynthesis protein CobD n=1 Tax=Petrocella atlantisensis TaxID=2173034 RepID=A0A3P7PQ86_9FIRM|nr:adenosylcobinamide-phosphate synthase CbiB [Petrocella atlantisensis]VDN46567.1 Cobalamin biosynthesis protein CobD [Petrocella atlantisensis]